MKIIGMLGIAAVLFGTTALADTPAPKPFHVGWQFSAYSGDAPMSSRAEDYSTNLGLELATTLPYDLVKAGWSCTRKPVRISGSRMDPYMFGEFRCSNGTMNSGRSAFASCSLSHSDEAAGNMLLSFTKNGKEEWLVFDVRCQSSQ